MPKWLFTTGIMKGCYNTIDADGIERQHTGLDLVLGIAEGPTIEEAVQKITRQSTDRIPTDKHMLIGYQLEGKEETVRIQRQKASEEQLATNQIYETTKCKWCGGSLPRNGAAQFAHLRKHLNLAVIKKLLTKEEANAIRTIKVSPEIDKLLEQTKFT